MEYNILTFNTLPSTNDEAKRRAALAAPEGTVILTQNQTNGRGRQDRAWEAAPGECLTFSVILRPEMPMHAATPIALVIGLAVCRALSSFVPQAVQVKWPNDIVAEGRKLCGILCEQIATPGEPRLCVVAGIGINTNQQAFTGALDGKAASLHMLTGCAVSNEAVLHAVLLELAALYPRFTQEGFAAFTTEYNAACANTNRQVQALHPSGALHGIARGVNAAGHLLLETDMGMETLHSGEVSVRLADGRYI